MTLAEIGIFLLACAPFAAMAVAKKAGRDDPDRDQPPETDGRGDPASATPPDHRPNAASFGHDGPSAAATGQGKGGKTGL